MSTGAFFQIRLDLPDAGALGVWRGRGLLAERETLTALPAFDQIDMGDDDLFGGEITVTGVSTLDEALAYLASVGLPITGERVVETRAVESDGEPAVWFAEAGPLPRDATVSDLLSYLADDADPDDVRTEVVSAADDPRVLVHGLLHSYDAFREYRLPLVYAAAAALGATGAVSFLGDTDDEFVALFVDFTPDGVRIAQPDPQDLDPAGLAERFGYDIDTVYARWTAA
jgi:hypothetical protein